MWTLVVSLVLADDPAPTPFVADEWGVPIHFDAGPIFVHELRDAQLPGAAPGPRHRLRPAAITGFSLGVLAAVLVTYPAGAALALATNAR